MVTILPKKQFIKNGEFTEEVELSFIVNKEKGKEYQGYVVVSGVSPSVEGISCQTIIHGVSGVDHDHINKIFKDNAEAGIENFWIYLKEMSNKLSKFSGVVEEHKPAKQLEKPEEKDTNNEEKHNEVSQKNDLPMLDIF